MTDGSLEPKLKSSEPLAMTNAGALSESLWAGAVACVLIGLGVSLPIIGVGYFLAGAIFATFYSSARFPFFALLVAGGAVLAMIFLRDSRFSTPRRLPSSVLWALRYLFVGSALGFVLALLLGGYVSALYAGSFFGAAIGTVCGGVGGAFHGWLAERGRG